jgi:hypothetical protein
MLQFIKNVFVEFEKISNYKIRFNYVGYLSMGFQKKIFFKKDGKNIENSLKVTIF